LLPEGGKGKKGSKKRKKGRSTVGPSLISPMEEREEGKKTLRGKIRFCPFLSAIETGERGGGKPGRKKEKRSLPLSTHGAREGEG